VNIYSYSEFIKEENRFKNWALIALMSLGLSKSYAQSVDLKDSNKLEVVKTLYDYNNNPTSIERLKSDLSKFVKNPEVFIASSMNINTDNRITLKPSFNSNLELFISPFGATLGLKLPLYVDNRKKYH
jgi:hypothetical protein